MVTQRGRLFAAFLSVTVAGAQPVMAEPTSFFPTIASDDALSSTLIGAEVYARNEANGAPIGVIRDLIIAEYGAVRGVVIGVGGVAGVGERRVAAPYSALTRVDDQRFVIEADGLDAAPTFDARGRTAQDEALEIFKTAGERAEALASMVKEGTAQFYDFTEALVTGEQ
ncbi:MAG: PRC-barrel domain-containing protein [Pseudomonadota bacterium]